MGVLRFGSLDPTSFRNSRCTFLFLGLAQGYLRKTFPEFTELFEMYYYIKPLKVHGNGVFRRVEYLHVEKFA